MKRYQPKEIEPKWQKNWAETKIYQTDLRDPGGGFYGFGMFNYPSGAGIHVGHVKNFTIPDVLIRIKRQQGVNVYSPVGFDSFGLPAENYALKTGAPPRQTIDEAIADYSRQFRAVGFSHDWSRLIDTSQPEYYRWTQWCFLKLYQAGLAYQKENPQWWCDQCLTVLADEQVVNGRCWRHDDSDDPIIGKKSLKQWFFKTTAYADAILEKTASLKWTEWVKTAQINHIGRSVGLEADFDLDGLGLEATKVTIFTTAIETIYGATLIVLAPEHQLVETIIAKASNGAQIKDYCQEAAQKSDLQRQQAGAKTGTLVTDLVAIHPLTGARLPVWIADYVLAGYGTGAIMAVPGADSRDLQFAEAKKLPVIYPTTTAEFVAYDQIKANPEKYHLRSVGIADQIAVEETMAAAKEKISHHLINHHQARPVVNYRLRDWLISRQRYWGAPIPIIHCRQCGPQPVPEADLPVRLPEVNDYRPTGDGQSPLAKVDGWVKTVCPNCGADASRETDTMDGYVCSSWYQFRYLAANDDNQAWDREIAQNWLPVDFYNGADHVTAHLIYARFFGHFFYEQGYIPDPEPFARFYMHAKIKTSDGKTMSKSKGNSLSPQDVIDQGYGADALRVYVCFMAPLDVESDWSDDGVPGAYRFLSRCFRLISDYVANRPPTIATGPPTRLANLNNNLIRTYERSIAQMKFNTALAALMDFVNQLYKEKTKAAGFAAVGWQQSAEVLVMLLAPFAPHLASELWQNLDGRGSVHKNNWPRIDPDAPVAKTMTVVVTVDGRRRGQIDVDPDADEAEVLAAALGLDPVARICPEPSRVIYKPDHQIINLVSRSQKKT